MKLKNIIIVNDFAYIQGGASKVAIDTTNLLAKQNYQIYFFTGNTQDNQQILDGRVAIVSTDQPESLRDKNKLCGFKNGLYNKVAYEKITTLLDKLDPAETIVHFHGWTKILSSSVFEACFEKKFKTVLTLHDYFTACPNGGFYNYRTNQICPLRAMGEECFYTNCDSRNYAFKLYRVWRQKIQNDIGILSKIENVIYLSKLQWDILKDYFTNLKRAQQIMNPIDYPKNKCVKKQPNGYYLFVGRISPEKGIREFCDGITLAKVPAVVTGDGPLLPELQKAYPHIRFLGWRDHEQVVSLMMNAKSLIFPSLIYETAGLSPIEAASIGLPCIISDKTFTRELVKTNYIYNGNSPKALMETIMKFEYDYDKIVIQPQIPDNDYIDKLNIFYTEVLNDQ